MDLTAILPLVLQMPAADRVLPAFGGPDGSPADRRSAFAAHQVPGPLPALQRLHSGRLHRPQAAGSR